MTRRPSLTPPRPTPPPLPEGCKLRAEIVGDPIELAEEEPEVTVVRRGKRGVIIGWEGFDAALAVREMRKDQVARLNLDSEVRSASGGAMFGSTRLWSSQRLHQSDAVQELRSLVLPMIVANEVLPTSVFGLNHPAQQ